MAIKDIIARGIGFNPGGTSLIVTRGFSIGEAVVQITSGKGIDYKVKDRRTHYVAEDGRLHYTVDDGRLHYEAMQ